MITLNKEEISNLISINPPFLMIDSGHEIIPGKSSVALLELNPDLWFFDSHLKQEKVMPAALLTEAMLQTIILGIYTYSNCKGYIPFIVKTECNFTNRVSAGCVIRFIAQIEYIKRGIIEGSVTGQIFDKQVCDGKFKFVIPQLSIVPKK